MVGAINPECGGLFLIGRGGFYDFVSQLFDLDGFRKRGCPARPPSRLTARVFDDRINFAEKNLLPVNEYPIMIYCRRAPYIELFGLTQMSLASASIEKRPSRWKS